MARMTHPNIVKVMDYGEHEGAPYLVMEYLPGGTLKEKLGKPMPYQDAVKILLPIADALQYAHEQGLIHRDIKPSNILITQSGQPMLSDFGVAKVLESEETIDLTTTGMGVGTPEYMAPEMGIQKSFDHRADIYSLGTVLYELVTGKKPFSADTPLAVLLKHASEPLPRPTLLNPDLPEEAKRILFKVLAKDPKDRYADMGAFEVALDKTDLDRVLVKHRPRLLSDNGSCYLSRDLKAFLESKHMDHTRGAPYHPMTQGKIERYHRSMKNIVKLQNYYSPWELEREIARFVEYYNHHRYHESLDNLTPANVFFGRQKEVLSKREEIKIWTLEQRRLQNVQVQVSV